MIGYQIDGFTHTWSTEQFVAYFHWYGVTINPLSLEPGCEGYSFLNQAVADLDSILTDSLKTPELDTPLDEPDAVTSSFFWVSPLGTLFDNFKPQLVPSISSRK